MTHQPVTCWQRLLYVQDSTTLQVQTSLQLLLKLATGQFILFLFFRVLGFGCRFFCSQWIAWLRSRCSHYICMRKKWSHCTIAYLRSWPLLTHGRGLIFFPLWSNRMYYSILFEIRSCWMTFPSNYLQWYSNQDWSLNYSWKSFTGCIVQM